MKKPYTDVKNIFFYLLHRNNIIYNQCWEDPHIDKACLGLKQTDTMLVLTSAGCNILDYIVEDVKQIHAVDVNYRQNALLELKIAMIDQLDYETFFAFFGKGRIQNANTIYQKQIRPSLSTWAQKFWDKKIHLFDAKRKIGFYFSTTSGQYARLFNFTCRYILRFNKQINELIHADSLAEQTNIYYQLDDIIFSKYWKILLIFPVLLSLVGIPSCQFDLNNKQYPGGSLNFLRDSLRFVFTKTHIKRENYFWLLYLLGEYTRECCPAYLKEENFYKLKKMNLKERIHIHSKSLLDFLQFYNNKIDKFVLLDHFDWLSKPINYPIIRSEWEYIFKIATTNAKIIFRSAGIDINWMKNISVTHNSMIKPLGEHLRFMTEQAEKLHAIDRVHTYGSFHIATIK